jgi:hypothetical protein
MPTIDKSSSARTRALRNKTVSVYNKLNPTMNKKVFTADILIQRILGDSDGTCCTVVATPCTLPGEITNIAIGGLMGPPLPPYDTYAYYWQLTWDPVAGATSYTVTSSVSIDLIIQSSPTSTVADIYIPVTGSPGYLPDITQDSERIYTVAAINSCGSSSTPFLAQPCFLAGSLVQMADGTTKAIEDVCVNDLILGAFGEVNTVLALHRPVLGTASMCKINDEHSTTNHHPHISVDKKFYCGDPDLVSNSTYGRIHKVIDADGNIVDRMLHGLKKERIQKLYEGVELKTVEGSRVVRSLEVYSMPETTQLYNLVVSGSHTYHVDGYAVTGWPREDDFDYDRWM